MKVFESPKTIIVTSSFVLGTFPKTYISRNTGFSCLVYAETGKYFITDCVKNNKMPKIYSKLI